MKLVIYIAVCFARSTIHFLLITLKVRRTILQIMKIVAFMIKEVGSIRIVLHYQIIKASDVINCGSIVRSIKDPPFGDYIEIKKEDHWNHQNRGINNKGVYIKRNCIFLAKCWIQNDQLIEHPDVIYEAVYFCWV